MVELERRLEIHHQDQENHQQLVVQYFDLVSHPINLLSESYNPHLDRINHIAVRPLHQNHQSLQHVQAEGHFHLFNRILKHPHPAQSRVLLANHHLLARYGLAHDGHRIN